MYHWLDRWALWKKLAQGMNLNQLKDKETDGEQV